MERESVCVSELERERVREKRKIALSTFVRHFFPLNNVCPLDSNFNLLTLGALKIYMFLIVKSGYTVIFNYPSVW